MAGKKWISTRFKGVRFYEHPTRKHGVKFDRYFAIRYQKDGMRIEEGIGWTSEVDPEDGQNWTEAKAMLVLERLRGAARHGNAETPTRVAEKREIERKRREDEAAEKEREEIENVTFKRYYEDTYSPTASTSKKAASIYHEETHFRLWIDSVIGKKPLKNVTPFDIERIKKNLLTAGRTPRTCQHVMATIRQIWNMARRDGIVAGDSPTRSVKIPKFDNRRQRFLSHAEADVLLGKLKAKDLTVYKMALLSLHTGMRASEIFKLTWGCIDTERGLLTILDAKSGHGRNAFMTAQIKSMFEDMDRSSNDDHVFLDRKKKPYSEIPTLFRDTVAELKLNENVSDSRQRVCFHSLRHTMASWHAEAGTDLYVIKELLGHGSIQLTERYSHLSPGTLQNATKNLERALAEAGKDKTPEQGGQVVNLTK